jgi:drug/metabolite transporter (DMT)-like permease
MGLAAILVFATSASSILWIGRQVGVWQYLTLSCLVAGVGQVALYRMLGRKPRTLFILPPRLWALAVLGFVIYPTCLTVGLLTAVSDAQAAGVGLMNYLWPILTVVFSIFLVPGTRISVRLGVALVLALIGLAIANRHELGQVGVGSGALPFLLGGLAGICWGLYSALVARWRGWGQRYATAPAGLLMASAIGAIGCILTGEWHPIDTRTLLAILYVGLIPNAAGYMLWELALHRAPATTLGLMASATPVLSTLCLLGLFVLTGKSPSMPAHWGNLLAGAVLIAGAVLLVSAKSTAGRHREVQHETNNRESRTQHEKV